MSGTNARARTAMCKKIITGIAPSALSIAVLATSCGNLINSATTSASEQLIVRTFTEYVAPTGADGNANPNYYNITFNGVTLVASDGLGDETFNPTDTSFRIIERKQDVLTKDIKDLVGRTFSTAVVHFDSNITAVGKYKSFAVALDSGDISIVQDMTVKKRKSVLVQVKWDWRNTVQRDSDAKDETTDVAPALVGTIDDSN